MGIRLALFAVLGLGCATSAALECPGPASTCHDGGGGGPPADAATGGGAVGSACDGPADCAGGLCLELPGGGVCSQPCGDCPDGWSCDRSRTLGVDVCLPLGSALCGGCDDSADCTIVGTDLCLARPEGGERCARDCSEYGCPDGFTCEEVVVEQASFRQCLPLSGSCTCDVGGAGSTEACTIPTITGLCTGQRLCQGSTGWGSCEPMTELDLADGEFTDEDCDGVDGELAAAVVVAPDGFDDGACGVALDAPCGSIGVALDRAVALGRAAVFVQAGTYAEIVRLRDGVDLVGGFDGGWQRAPADQPGHEVRVVGRMEPATGEFVTLLAHDLALPTRVVDLVVVGPTATGSTVDRAGKASFAVHAARAAALTLERVRIEAGDGADGRRGADGGSAASIGGVAIQNAKQGGGASEFSSLCNASSRGAGGASGTNTCSGTGGGSGGGGGTMDEDCPGAFTAQPGGVGQSGAGFQSGGPGFRGAGGPTCQVGGDGRDGRVLNGAGGSGALAGGARVGDFYRTTGGGGGGLGENGGGGGGGGGSGGCDAGTDSHGAGGGGGGGGGCRAPSVAGGGGGGGASFGLFAVDSTVAAVGCAVRRGRGGAGGPGGTGGRGQSGGSGAGGGPGAGDSEAGGRGGRGGHGGHGGGGGGGAGGDAVAVYRSGGSVEHDCVATGGVGGDGGVGGLSAPSAPLAERDGVAGQAGRDGRILNVAP